MEELYTIMENFLQTEYDLDTLLLHLKGMEESYRKAEQQELEAAVHLYLYYLEKVKEILHGSIGKLDRFILKQKR